MPGSLPVSVEAGKVYVIPTRSVGPRDDDGAIELCYPDNVRYLPKAARANGLPVEFSLPEGRRQYLQEFSTDPEMWSLGLCLLTMASDWLILTVSLYIARRSEQQGWSTDEAESLPLRVWVAETETGKTYQIEGSGSDVLEALKELHRGAGAEEKRLDGDR